jgi:hypothetical protein
LSLSVKAKQTKANFSTGDVMGLKRTLVVFCGTTALLSGGASADLMSDLSRMKGYTIIHVGNVTGFVNDKGEKEDHFEGCSYGRKLIIDYSYQITCNTYNYEYAFNPDIIILTNGPSAKAIIEDDVYDVTL